MGAKKKQPQKKEDKGKKAEAPKKKTKRRGSEGEEEEEVDYAAAAEGEHESSSDDESEGEGSSSGNSNEQSESGSSSEEDEDGRGEEIVTTKKDKERKIDDGSETHEKVSDDDDDDDSSSSEGNAKENEGREESNDDEDDASEEEPGDTTPQQQSATVTRGSGEEPCTFDLRNLTAFNSHQVDAAKLYGGKNNENDNVTICMPATAASAAVNDTHLLKLATDGCMQLVSALWQQPIERSDAGPMALLPSTDESRIPRALPPPPPKKETKWEKFAKERGIPLNKAKRSRKVWDEGTGTWMYRHGYQKANDADKEWPIMEVKANQDPFEDPWERVREEKRARVEKNMESRLRNKERAGELARGFTNKTIRNREKVREAGKKGGNRDRDNVPPAGIPVDLKSRKGDIAMKSKLRGKDNTHKALLATQRSTASLGKFDKMREGEPERKKSLDKIKKRKFESPTDKSAMATETDRYAKLAKSIAHGGGAEKEKARKKGKLAKGETAYDYDFDDGLGASNFRKKKGRAGAGKARKMTKKRAK